MSRTLARSTRSIVPSMTEAMSDDSDGKLICLFCGQLIEETPLEGEVAFTPSARLAAPEYTTWSAHPRCFMEASHLSFREQGFFDSVTFRPTRGELSIPGRLDARSVDLSQWAEGTETGGDLFVVADFRPPDAHEQFRRWRGT
jgi:hypothetical protein